MSKDIFVDLKEFTYDLPENKIALEGTKNRDESKLLYYRKGAIKDYEFSSIPDLIPEKTTLFFNNTKVIPARILMARDTGAQIEIFLLKPAYNKDISQVLEASQSSTWECMIGNFKKWNINETLSFKFQSQQRTTLLQATLIDREKRIVQFTWDNNQSFAQVLDILGKTPLPPYIKRPSNNQDKDRYQTVYSKIEGAVAAPTAGLHFTKNILNNLKERGVKESFFTLHVGAGTFMPIKADSVQEHPMHNESMIVPVEAIKSILTSEFRIAVGTTSMRTIESLYWYGVMLLENPDASFLISKLYPYEYKGNLPSTYESFEAILAYARKHNKKELIGETEIFIFPGYKFKVCNGLITNLHQPGSTLILLVAAFVGKSWRNIYNHALSSNYRFLSFGDSSLLIP